MAVKKSQRGEGHLRVVILANDLTAYTLRLLCNEELFSKRSRWLLAGKLADTINDFHTAVHTANELRVTTAAEAADRHRLQTRSLAYLYAAEAKMELAADVLQLDVDRLDHWSGMVNDEIKLLTGWMSKDAKRYSDLK